MSSFPFHRFPLEISLEILRLAAWAASEVDKAWLCAIATSSRAVWTIVRPILYDTVCLSKFRHARNVEFKGAPGFALTRRLYGCSLHGIDITCARLAQAFSGVEHFSGWDRLFFALSDEPDARFRPPLASLSMTVLSAQRERSLHVALHGLTHVHLAFGGTYDVSGVLALPLRKDCALRYVILEEAAQHERHPAALVSSLLPFFAPAALLERILVRVSFYLAQADETVAVLKQYARASGENRLWIVTSTPTRGFVDYEPGVSFDESKWTAGQTLGSLLEQLERLVEALNAD